MRPLRFNSVLTAGRAPAAQRKGRRDVPHPNVVDRRFNHGDVGTGGELSSRFARRTAARGEQANRLMSCDGLHDLAEFALDLIDGLAPLAVDGPSHPATGVRFPFGGNTYCHLFSFITLLPSAESITRTKIQPK
jgi:hypothetical protein